MSALDKTADGLRAFLSREWGADVAVSEPRVASAGARRLNVMFDATRGGETQPLVATIVPNAAIQVMGIDVEASNLRLAEDAGMPVPHVHAVCEDTTFVGGPFFVSARLPGETIPRRVLRLIEAHPGLGETLARQCGRALGALHSADPDKAHAALPRPETAPAEQALSGVKALIEGLLQPSPAFALGYRWLARHCPPPPTRLGVVHGDFRNGNLLVSERGLEGTLDWEICHVGDPMEDVAWLCQRMWRFRNDTLEVGGFARRDALREGYVEAGGAWDEKSFHWWKTLGTLRWGLGLAGQAAAHLDGSVPNIIMAASGRRVAELEYDVLMLIRTDYV